MVRKRKPGGGRKPKGPAKGLTENFSTRISPEMRSALEREAAATGQSISQVAAQLMRLGIQTKRDREADDPLRALCFLIRELNEVSSMAPKAGKRLDWRTNPFAFEALQHAIPIFMEILRPEGEVVAPTIPDDIAFLPGPHGTLLPGPYEAIVLGPYDSPVARAKWAAENTAFKYRHAESLPWHEAIEKEAFSPEERAYLVNFYERRTYSYVDAKRALEGGKK